MITLYQKLKKGIKIQFTKNDEIYEIDITKKSVGRTSMTDYYVFGDILSYNEFIELEDIANRAESAVSKWDFKQV